MTYDDLKGRVAVVTGGSRGTGAATALAFARNGMRVAVLGRDEEGLAGRSGASANRRTWRTPPCTWHPTRRVGSPA